MRSKSARSLPLQVLTAMKFLICFVLFWGGSLGAFAQVPDSVSLAKRPATDSIPPGPAKKPFVIVPQKATYRSLMLPGLGQAYVKQYWTIPIIYAGFGGLGYAIHWNQVRYSAMKSGWQEYLNQVAAGQTPSVDVTLGGTKYTFTREDSFRAGTAQFRRQRDLSIIGCFALYALQLVEANVTAHLKTFDNTDDISLQFRPGVQSEYFSTPMGVTAVFTFK